MEDLSGEWGREGDGEVRELTFPFPCLWQVSCFRANTDLRMSSNLCMSNKRNVCERCWSASVQSPRICTMVLKRQWISEDTVLEKC